MKRPRVDQGVWGQVQAGVLLAGVLLGSSAMAATLPDAQVLVVDMQRLESATGTLQRLQAEAAARKDLNAGQRQQAVELALSEILTVVPETVASVAEARKADLVVLRAAWPHAVDLPEDITDAVIEALDARLAGLRLEVP